MRCDTCIGHQTDLSNFLLLYVHWRGTFYCPLSHLSMILGKRALNRRLIVPSLVVFLDWSSIINYIPIILRVIPKLAFSNICSKCRIKYSVFHWYGENYVSCLLSRSSTARHPTTSFKLCPRCHSNKYFYPWSLTDFYRLILLSSNSSPIAVQFIAMSWFPCYWTQARS